MIELQVLNYAIANKSLDLLLHNNITPDKFSESYSAEATFVYDHYNHYGKVPDYATMLDTFDDFEVIEVLESPKYLVNKFRDSYVYRLQVDSANKWGELLGEDDSQEALNHIKSEIDRISRIDIGTTVGVDLVNYLSRLERYKEALTNPKVTGIPTGIKELDNILHGILPNDLVVLAARTNQGKSFVGLKIAANIWSQKKKVLFYSGENSVLNTAYRFDTVLENFSNTGLMYGHKDLKNNKNEQDYENFIYELKKKDVPFIVVTPQELHGQRLGITKLKSLTQLYKPDIIFLDQLSLMTDDRSRSNLQERFRYSHIMEDLRLFVESTQIPVVVMSQTSRNNTANDDGILEPARIEHLSESDGVGQNATKVLTFAVNKGVLNMIVRKNTNGEKERGFKLIWDIDTGTFMEFVPEEFDNDTDSEYFENLIEEDTLGKDIF